MVEVTIPLSSSETTDRRDVMLAPDDVTAMIRLQALGWGTKRIARELGCDRKTVKRYLRGGGWHPYRSPRRAGRLDDLTDWLGERFRRHRGNADVVRQELADEHGVQVSLRTVERAVQGLRQDLEAESRATVRFETAPGQQLQIDFGTTAVEIGGERMRVHLFVATLGYSRRNFVTAFRHERQSAWITGLEAAFRHFEGVPHEVLIDNPKTLVTHHDRETREVTFNDRFHAFARYWGFRPRACAPYRARTKGKDENGVGYVKKNAVAGRRFASWEAFEGHLVHWMRTIADVRVHGTTGDRPIDRFQAAEAVSLRPLNGRPPYLQVRELHRKVQSDGTVGIDTNHYSVPWRLIGQSVTVEVSDGTVRVLLAGSEVARHVQASGRRQRVIDARHLDGVVGVPPDRSGAAAPHTTADATAPRHDPDLLRPLAEYEAVIGGGW
ncbi:IS21 family transposase [Azospirillum ramasamyi]